MEASFSSKARVLKESQIDVGQTQTEIQMAKDEEAPTNPIACGRSQESVQIEIEIEKDNITLDEDVVSSIFEGLTKAKTTHYIQKLRETETATMCRVPEEIIGANNDRAYFKPKIIPIGPYHSKNEAFSPIQNLKLRYLNDLLHRNSEINKVEKYIKAVRELLFTAKAKYCEFDACGISDAEFLKMLVLDGCFIVELLLKYAEGPTIVLPGIDIDILNHDLVLIENQVPFSILEVIYTLTDYDEEKLKLEERCSIFDLAIYFLGNRKRNIGAFSEIKEDGEVDHLLHLLYTLRLAHFKRVKATYLSMWLWFGKHILRTVFVLPWIFVMIFWRFLIVIFCSLLHCLIINVESFFALSNEPPTNGSFDKKSNKKYFPWIMNPMVLTTIPTAKEVNYAGMRFCNNVMRPYNMFYLGGVMYEGKKEINDNFFTEFENMLFYEQIYAMEVTEKEIVWKREPNNSLPRNVFESYFADLFRFRRRRSTISTYAVYMWHLVKTDMDVDVLSRHGMLEITTTTHGAKEIAEFFNKCRSWLVLSKNQLDFLCQQFEAINKFCNTPHRKRRTKLMKDYFTNTLVIFSFVGFLILLTFTTLQTVFTIVK